MLAKPHAKRCSQGVSPHRPVGEKSTFDWSALLLKKPRAICNHSCFATMLSTLPLVCTGGSQSRKTSGKATQTETTNTLGPPRGRLRPRCWLRKKRTEQGAPGGKERAATPIKVCGRAASTSPG